MALPESNMSMIEEGIRMILKGLGESPDREGIRETPKRVARMYSDILDGNFIEKDEFTSFGGEEYEGAVMVHHVPFYAFCVVGSTFVETPKGRIPISQLKTGDWIYTVDPKTMILGLAKAHNPRITQRQASLVRVITDNDAVICTPNHKFLLTTGKWVEAKDLANNNRIVSLYRSTSVSTNGKAYTRLVSTFERHRNGVLITDGTLLEHQFVAEQMGLIVPPGGLIHHADEQLWNNDPSNLEALTKFEHNGRHQRTIKLANSQARKDAAAEASGRPETRALRSQSVTAYWANLTPEERAERGRKVSEAKASNHTVVGVETLSYREDVWCMDVPGTQTFFANGMAVHNCEHHMSMFHGHFGMAYIPGDRILGISKLVRIFRVGCKKITIQERITEEAVALLEESAKPIGSMCYVQAEHTCMSLRGVKSPGSLTTTWAYRGEYEKNLELRQQFINEASK